MNKFEVVLLASPDITSTAKNTLYKDFSKQITDNSGKIIDSEDWGLRDLSYQIGNYNKAFYNFIQIEIEVNKIESLKKNLNQNESFIRHIFIKVNNHQELPTKLSNEKK